MFFLRVHGVVFRSDHLVGYETCWQFKEIEVIGYIIMKDRRKLENLERCILWKLNNTLLNNQQVRANDTEALENILRLRKVNIS
jgi:hypothetical protein